MKLMDVNESDPAIIINILINLIRLKDTLILLIQQ